MREKLFSCILETCLRGITPACAGKTFKIGDSMPRGWDHPRMCGKNSISSNEVSHTPGSPPHVREKRNRKYCLNLCSGITPACAGKTKPISTIYFIRRDHPRMCGKNATNTTRAQAILGSPPHVREKRDQSFTLSIVIGITPACAGKTLKNPCLKLL